MGLFNLGLCILALDPAHNIAFMVIGHKANLVRN